MAGRIDEYAALLERAAFLARAAVLRLPVKLQQVARARVLNAAEALLLSIDEVESEAARQCHIMLSRVDTPGDKFSIRTVSNKRRKKR